MSLALPMFYVALAFLLFLALGGLAHWLSRAARPENDNPLKRKMYASGEDLKPSRSNIPAESFYKVLTKSFGFDRFAKLHTGDLSRYLTWIFTGLVAVIILLMLVWT